MSDFWISLPGWPASRGGPSPERDREVAQVRLLWIRLDPDTLEEIDRSYCLPDQPVIIQSADKYVITYITQRPG